MEEGLGHLTEFTQTGERRALLAGGAQIDRAAFQLNQAVLDFRNGILAAEGPTDIPNLNLFLRLHEEWKEEGEEDHFLSVVHEERFHTLAQIQDLEKEPDLVEVRSLVDAYEDHLRCMNRLAQALEAARPDQVDAEIEHCRKTFQWVGELIPATVMALRGHGKTPFPDINMLVKLSQQMAEAKLSDRAFLDALESVAQSFGETRQKLSYNPPSGEDSVLLKEEYQRANRAFDLMEVALDELFAFIETRNLGLLKLGACRLEEAALALHQAHLGLQTVADREGKTPCIRCSHYNPQERSHCESCGSALPVMPGRATSTFEHAEGPQSQADAMVVTANLLKVYEAVNRVSEGEISLEEFGEVLDWFENMVEVNYHNVPALEGEGHEEVVVVIDGLFEEAVALYRQGLECFRGFAEDGLKAGLRNGVVKFDQATRNLEKISRAYQPPPKEE